MTTIRAQCRERFTADDLEFVAGVVSSSPSVVRPQSSVLSLLVSDSNALEAALDDERVIRSLLESPARLPVSSHLYFYVLTRHMLRRFGRDVSDYVASVLAGFVDERRAVPTTVGDLLIALKSASSEKEFMIRVQVGNHSLFLTGIFPQNIAQRCARHAAPPLSFYEEIGSESYRRASDHRCAREQALVETYRKIAESFTELRRGLNQMSDRLLCLETMP